VEFEVEPTRVTRGSKALPIIAAVAIALALGLAVVMADRDREVREAAAALPSTAPATQTASASAVPELTDQVAAATPVRAQGPLDPALVHCHDVGRADCMGIASAAVAAVQASGSRTDRVDVWPSILCSDLFDCPLATLARLRPLGSAVVHIQGRKTVAWVNVGANTPHGPPRPTDPPPEAWIVRWFY
jgi:hypothetical protein